ncbi:MAG: DoxX family protein [Flavisolibacter sp.]
MKKITAQSSQKTIDVALLIARMGVAALMLTHGIPKLVMLFSGAPVQFPPVFGMNPSLALALTVFAEVFCSILLLAGFATRLAAIPLAFTMLTAALLIHAGDPIGTKEPALQYLLVYLVLLFAGSGKYSVDYLLQRKKLRVSYVQRPVEDPTFAIYP